MLSSKRASGGAQRPFLRYAGSVLFGLSWPLAAQSPSQPIKNFYQVDQHVYRGAQPTQQGFDFLNHLGVKTVIDLREADQRSKEEEKLVTAAGMKYINVPMTGLTPPTEAEIDKILEILEDQGSGPVYVHCKRGADRTGAVIAAYRIEHDHWDNSRALKEAMDRGMSFFQLPRQGYIRGFQPRRIEAQAPTSQPEAGTLPDGVLKPATAQ
ncbi:MAG TPA: tyrosine-protein phosphatase [Bryobacteraceae bacterium]|nr:tyrosine-protein phosphatase [Bryobacteraceae bacterium]